MARRPERDKGSPLGLPGVGVVERPASPFADRALADGRGFLPIPLQDMIRVCLGSWDPRETECEGYSAQKKPSAALVEGEWKRDAMRT